VALADANSKNKQVRNDGNEDQRVLKKRYVYDLVLLVRYFGAVLTWIRGRDHPDGELMSFGFRKEK
jgi:hypothetical protein